ncbi:G-type lectin S-receptor-like serine/threonine-protein kinase RLK1 [Glycine soja]|uniref:G-type lectin S-receptor-like serine/threonine-protein kinase RLK1 n=1 Tax=Glycine soja TaxID=3848 RepID=A0A445LA76_GLYSO|nr:G-type lectin S-receptor-like serine/threonine-protein kinase RLK1 [Glycine soja]
MVSPQLATWPCSMVLLQIFVVAQTRSNKIIGHSLLKKTSKASWMVSPHGQSRRNIVVGDSLLAETTSNNNNLSSWVVSPLGDFAFGFVLLEDTNNFLVFIWYAKIPEKIVVWYTNGETPASKGSKVELTADDESVLTVPNGELLWKNDNHNGKDPRDTLLPSQPLEKGEKLLSRFLESNFSKGRFELLLQMDGILSIHALNSPSEYANENYCETRTEESNTSSPGTRLVFEPLGFCTLGGDQRSSCQCPKWYSLLDPNHPYGSSKLDFIQGCAEDELIGRKEDVAEYDFEVLINTDWPLSDYVLLKPFTEEQCKQSCLEDWMCAVTIFRSGVSSWPHFRFSLSPLKTLSFSRSPPNLSQKNDDLQLIHRWIIVKFEHHIHNPIPSILTVGNLDIMSDLREIPLTFIVGICEIIFVEGEKGIAQRQYKWRLQSLLILSNIWEPYQSNQRKKLRNPRNLLEMLLSLLEDTIFFFIFQYKKKLRGISKSEKALETNLHCFNYKELQRATNGFQKELGRGSFGVVYERVINIGSAIPIAVKKLNNLLFQQVEKEFKNELQVIGLTHHKNLVRLIGYL